MFTKKVIPISLLLIFTSPVWLLAEGTRELQPRSDCGVNLYPTTETSYDPFATSVCDDEHKLWVSIGATGEKVLFGFRCNGVSVCIKSASGTIVFPVTPIPNSGQGHIETYEQAVAGPNTINPDGYTPFEFTPSGPGDYYIEFSNSSTISLFDITVVDAMNVEKRGRLWSKNWQLYTNGTYTPFWGTMYPYTDDQITTKIDFNGMAPARFTVACNATGCNNTGNFLEDRKSRSGRFTYPAYKIFVNNPDETLFPTGIIGGVDSVNVVNPCDGSVDILMYVNKLGIADILLDINPLPGVQAEDITLNDTVFSGDATIIHWDGLNGLGEAVPNGTTFNININYVNGLTHLPMYDVEYSLSTYIDSHGNTVTNKWPGFIVDLIRPAGDKPLVFWDDRDLLPTSFNLDGCNDPVGCHFWGSANSSVGNNDTYNTWWFAVSNSMVPISINYRRSDFEPLNYILCDGDSVNVFGNWVSAPGIFRDTATNFMGCDSITEITVTVKPGPVIDLGEDQILCQGESTTLGMTVPDVINYEWNTIPPGPTPLGTNPTLTVNTTNTYQVKITASNGCIRTDQVHVTAAPMINPVIIKHN